MSQNTVGSNDLNNENDINSSLGNIEENQQNESHASGQQDPTATPEEIENANKPQPNVILNKIPSAGHLSSVHRDTERVAARANEASDSTDTNTGGIVAGAAKGASQS